MAGPEVQIDRPEMRMAGPEVQMDRSEVQIDRPEMQMDGLEMQMLRPEVLMVGLKVLTTGSLMQSRGSRFLKRPGCLLDRGVPVSFDHFSRNARIWLLGCERLYQQFCTSLLGQRIKKNAPRPTKFT